MASKTSRIIDANSNRAREALRVMEEAARFLLDCSGLSKSIKSLRHDFASIIKQTPQNIAWRDTPSDVGTQIATPQESSRQDINDVVIAACKRLSEALRTIEEYTKIDSPKIASQIQTLRYQGYTLEKQLTLALTPTKSSQWKTCVLITESLCTLPYEQVLKDIIDANVSCIQIREKHDESGTILQKTKLALSLAKPKNIPVIVNDRPDIAAIAGAQGVHLGQGDLPVSEVIKHYPNLIVGLSTCCVEEAQDALTLGADYCGIGPMYPTSTKQKDVIVGQKYLEAYTQWNKLPYLAIGGIDQQNLNPLIEVGCKGIAISSVVCNSKTPKLVVQNLNSQFEKQIVGIK